MAFEDYTTFTKVDASGLFTVSENQIIVSGLYDVQWGDDRIYKDYGTNHFSGNFTHQFKYSADETIGDAGYLCLYYISNSSSGPNYAEDGSGISIVCIYNEIGNYISVDFWPNDEFFEFDPLPTGSELYVTFQRTGSKYDAYVRYDNHTSTPIISGTYTDSVVTPFKYIYGAAGFKGF